MASPNTPATVRQILNMTLGQWKELRQSHLTPFLYKHGEKMGWDTGTFRLERVKYSEAFMLFARDTKIEMGCNHADSIWCHGLAKRVHVCIDTWRKGLPQKSSSASPSASPIPAKRKQQHKSQATTAADITIRASTSIKNKDTRSILLRKLTADTSDPEVIDIRQLRAAKLMEVLQSKCTPLTEATHNVYDSTLDDDDSKLIAHNDDLEAAITSAMVRGDKDVFFVVTRKGDNATSSLESMTQALPHEHQAYPMSPPPSATPGSSTFPSSSSDNIEAVQSVGRNEANEAGMQSQTEENTRSTNMRQPIPEH